MIAITTTWIDSWERCAGSRPARPRPEATSKRSHATDTANAAADPGRLCRCTPSLLLELHNVHPTPLARIATQSMTLRPTSPNTGKVRRLAPKSMPRSLGRLDTRIVVPPVKTSCTRANGPGECGHEGRDGRNGQNPQSRNPRAARTIPVAVPSIASPTATRPTVQRGRAEPEVVPAAERNRGEPADTHERKLAEHNCPDHPVRIVSDSATIAHRNDRPMKRPALVVTTSRSRRVHRRPRSRWFR